jgi:putative endonuclease
MSHDRIALGKQGEDLAVEFFRVRGYRLVARNWRCRYGEIDLIVQRGGDLRAVEVKTRQSLGAGYPEEAVDHRKLEHLEAAIDQFLDEHPELPLDCHLDVLSITFDEVGQPQYYYLPDVE